MHRYKSNHFGSSCTYHHPHLHLGLVTLQWDLIHQLQTLVRGGSTNGSKPQKCVWFYGCSYHHMMYVEMPWCNIWQFHTNKPSLLPQFSNRYYKGFIHDKLQIVKISFHNAKVNCFGYFPSWLCLFQVGFIIKQTYTVFI